MAEVSETGQELALVSPSDIVFCDPGDDAVLSCHLEPAISAVSMEIKWWNKTDLVCHYKNRQVTVSRHYEDRASFSLQELNTGNVSLTIRDVGRSQRGIYICEVIHGCQTIKEYIFLHICSQDFKLVVPAGPVCTDSGSDIILRAHLLPETNAVSMDIRWFKGTELIYHYKNGREMTNNDYRNQVSLSIQELKRGNLALCLRNVNQSDSGDYTCKLFHDQYQKTEVIHLQVRMGESSTDTQTLTHERFSERCKEWMRQVYQLREQESLSSDLTTKRRRRNSMEGGRPSMSNDSTLEKPEIEKREPRAIVERESGHQNPRRAREGNTATGQELSSPDMSSQVLQMLKTPESETSVGQVNAVVGPIMLTPKSIQQKQTVFTRPALTRPSLDISTSRVLVRPSLTKLLQAAQMLEDREQSRLKKYHEKMPNNLILQRRRYAAAAAATTTSTTTYLTKTKPDHLKNSPKNKNSTSKLE